MDVSTQVIKLANEALSTQRMNESIAFFNKKQPQRAMELIEEAIALNPSSALAYFNRGALHFRLSNLSQMQLDFQTAVNLDPQNGDMLTKMASLLTLAGLPHQAIKVAQRGLEILPDSEELWFTLLNGHYMFGNMETAFRLGEHIAAKFPKNSKIRLADAFFVPQVAMSNEHIDAMRARLLRKLDECQRERLRFADPLQDMRGSLFYLPYQGRSNKEMAQTIAQFYLASCPPLNYTAPHCQKPRKSSSETLRVGFVSPSMHQPTLNQFFMGLIDALDETPGFESWIFSSAPPAHPEVLKIKERTERYVDLPPDYEVSVQAIARQKPDILVYLEVGAHALMYALPFARLAPVQCVLGGLPVTTGIPNMDYFISSRDSEPEDAQVNYSETLLLTQHECAVVKGMPPLTGDIKSRAELGLPTDDVRLYACPVQLFKIHPDMDPVFEAILRRDPKARIVFYDKQTTILQNLLRKRFAERLSPEDQARILFLPYAPRDEFMHHMRAMDAVMDSFHFSFGTIAYLAVAAGAPFVTWPGPYFSGRASYRIFTRMQIPELIAKNHEDYVEIVLKLAQDKAFYQQAAEKIVARRAPLFDDYSGVPEFIELLKTMYFTPSKATA